MARVSEAAYPRCVGRGVGDGYDVDDWHAAEGDVERELCHVRESAEP